MITKIGYVNFHDRQYIDKQALLDALRELTDNGKKVISVDKLIEWVETIEFPERG